MCPSLPESEHPLSVHEQTVQEPCPGCTDGEIVRRDAPRDPGVEAISTISIEPIEQPIP